jgi:GNAT superfamily N-acetyltransferase
MTIRPARVEDVPAILDLIRGLAEYERLLDQVEATEEGLRQTLFPPAGETPVARCVIASVDREAVGFAIYFFNYSTFLARPGLYLEDLFVKPAYRGRGYGKALLLHVAGIANARGCGRMEWAVLDWNAAAIAFYESLGARRLREWQLCRLTGDALARYR